MSKIRRQVLNIRHNFFREPRIPMCPLLHNEVSSTDDVLNWGMFLSTPSLRFPPKRWLSQAAVIGWTALQIHILTSVIIPQCLRDECLLLVDPRPITLRGRLR